jgi:hypothetical protein
MNKVVIIFLAIFISTSCNQKDNGERKVELKKYEENGKLIVYSEEEYAKMWTKNRKLSVIVIDTFCINQKYRAIKDIKNGKLIYFGFHPREFKKLTKMLSKYGIETKEYLGSCIRVGVFEPDCYQKEMWNEIDKRYGENFVDSLFKIAQKEYILENPNLEYMEDGIDLREKYLKNKNSN